MSADALFNVRGLTKSYAGAMVLDHVDFAVQRGECLVILGRSGSGKSVTLRQLNGLERPDSGSIRFAGAEVTELEDPQLVAIRRRMAMLFQSGALFDSMTVFDNVAFPLREHTDLDDDAIRTKVDEKLGLVKLKDIEEKMPADLSGGMKKRVALARSLALDPEAVLFDEPTGGLDPVTAATIGHLILNTRKKTQVTAIIVTHDLRLTHLVADRVAFLDQGRFRFIGTLEEAKTSDDERLAGFLAGREEDADAA